MTINSDEMQLNIQRQKLALVLENNISSSLGNLGVALLISLILNYFTHDSMIAYWLAFMVVISVVRLVIGRHIFNHIKANKYFPVYENIIFVFVLLTALGWGLSSVLFITQQTPIANSYVAIAIAGIVAGSTASLIPIRYYFYTFVLLTLLPVLCIFIDLGSLENYFFGLMVFLFILFMLRNGQIFSENITQNIQLLLKNKTLIHDLQLEKNKALEASDLKSQFLTNMSHEIRTPLNAILGFIRLLKESEKDPEKSDYLTTVADSSEDLLGIIRDVLDFSKIESNQITIENVVFNPQKELLSSSQLFKDKAFEKSIDIQVVYTNEIPKLILSDPFRLRQVMNNLISNAIKFSPMSVVVLVEIGYDFENALLKVAVIDNGIGISHEKLEHIFEAFTQVDGSSTRQYGGSGLGLAICSKLIALLGGKLKVESNLGEGSRFYFSIYAQAQENSSFTSMPVRSQSQNQHFSGHVLVVEDNLVNQKLLTILLKKVGLSFVVANDGLEAVKAFQEVSFDLILMDENMPNLSGMEATQRIRKLEQEKGMTEIPIVAVTASAMEGDRAKFIQSGMNEYLTKPINVPQLYQVLRHYLKAD